MKYLIPVLLAAATIIVGITTAVAQAHGAFTGNAALKPYLYGYATAAVLFLLALATAIHTGTQESKPNALQESKHKELAVRFAALMKWEVELRQRLISAPGPDQFTQMVKERDQWISETGTALNEAEFHTAAEGFFQIRHLAPTAEYVDQFRHVEDWKREELARLAMYRKKLDQIIDVKRL